ncbi:putative CHCH domain containing protein [Lyophyllum shimeji]|uniref:Mitochondrial intermembrane space import and assembly protein 40 n=1 Tax=Lyophyllum shimeji TaxID=47721 RepID=A0A9P3PL93_LYOSH|nr:putative CHCH domain containing protein [Lyophyllum shimeji]
MFSRFTRLPLRRCLHTLPPRSSRTSNRFGLTVGASAAVAATYLTWRLTSDSHSIALDSATKFPATQQRNASRPSEPALLVTSESPSSSEPVLDVTKAPGTSELPEETKKAAPTDAEGSTEDGGSGGAFNPVTGEINWDCPCLGGMAHGPCGAQFREAFSCFVFSEEEPKGINCVDKFKAMQDCFREHPDVYGDEIMDDDEEEPAPSPSPSPSPSPAPTTSEGALLASSVPNSDDAVPEPATDATNTKARRKRPAKTTS